MELEEGAAYENAYFAFIDASGHSTVVRANPRDRASEAFDLLESKVRARFGQAKRHSRCDYVEAWGWQGDGGLFILWDPDESKTNATALEAARALVELDLVHARDEFRSLGIKGELHLRVSVHRGTLSYQGHDRRGSIHSPDLNFAAHLEKACPRDCVAVSKGVVDAAGALSPEFRGVGSFEGEQVYVWAPGLTQDAAQRRWLTTHGLAGGQPVSALHERPSQAAKASFISIAEKEVVDLGTALRTCANYLVSGERPRPYRDAVVGLLERGITYKCVVLTGGDERVPTNPLDPAEDLASKTNESLEKLARFRADLPPELAERFEVWGSTNFPGCAALAVDARSDDGLILYSPYLPRRPLASGPAERGDMPHYLVAPSNGRLYREVRDHVRAFAEHKDLERLL